MAAMPLEQSLQGRRWLVLASAVVSFFAVGVTFFAVPPLIPELVERFRLSHLAIGVLMGAIAVPAIFLSIPFGAAVDRWPPRSAGLAALGLMALGAGVFAVAPGYGALLAGRLLFGVGGLVMNLLLARLLAAAFSGRELALAMGVFMAVYPASMIATYSGHEGLEALLGWRLELGVLALLAVLAMPLHLLAVPRAAAGGGGPGAAPAAAPPAISPPLLALAAAWMLFFAAFASVATFAPEWAGGGARGLLTVTVVMWVSLVGSPAAGWLLDRMGGAAWWVVVGMAALGGVLAAMSSSGLPPLVAMFLVGCVAAMVTTATYALPPQLVPPERVGFAFGFITAFSNLGTVLGPAAVGAVRDATGGWASPWAVLAAVAVLGAACAAVVARRAPVGASR